MQLLRMQLSSCVHARARIGALSFNKMMDPSLSLKFNDVVDGVPQRIFFVNLKRLSVLYFECHATQCSFTESQTALLSLNLNLPLGWLLCCCAAQAMARACLEQCRTDAVQSARMPTLVVIVIF